MRRNRQTKSTLEQLAEVCDEDPARATFETVGVEHHLAHIASAYFLSPFDEVTAGFSYDASGDFASMMAARCEGNRIGFWIVSLSQIASGFSTPPCASLLASTNSAKSTR